MIVLRVGGTGETVRYSLLGNMTPVRPTPYLVTPASLVTAMASCLLLGFRLSVMGGHLAPIGSIVARIQRLRKRITVIPSRSGRKRLKASTSTLCGLCWRTNVGLLPMGSVSL